MGKNKLVSINESNISIKGGNLMKKSIKKLFAGFSALTIIGTAFVGGHSAYAADSAITGGSLSITQPTIGSFAGVTLNGQIQTTNATMGAFTATDATGTGFGWNVVVKATQFSTGGATPLTLPNNSLALAAPTKTAQAGASDASTITTAAGDIDSATGVKILSADVNGGMGTYDITFPANALTLTLNPKDVKAGTYASTISVTVTSGP
jgi:hypothetical protein